MKSHDNVIFYRAIYIKTYNKVKEVTIMLSEISYALGSLDFLRDKETELKPERLLRLYSSSRIAGKYTLFDFSGKQSVFAAPIRLKPLHAVGEDDFRGFLNYQSFTLSWKERKLFRKWASEILDDTIANPHGAKLLTGYLTERKDDPGTTVLMTWWQSAGDLSEWLDSPSYDPLRQYGEPNPRNQYFFDQYHLAE